MSRFRAVLGFLLLRHPVWRRNWRYRLARILTCCVYAYLGVMLVLLTLEDRLLFPGATFGRPVREPPDDLRVHELYLSSGKETIHAWLSAPEGWEPSRGAVLHSHGNTGNVSTLVNRARNWQRHLGRAVVLYDYPGYGKSTGFPSEAGCYDAGAACFRWLTEEELVPPGEVILAGESLGGAIATELATRYSARLLVLHGAFASFPEMSQERFPVFPGYYLVHNQFANERKMASVRCPVFLSHGTADTVVPFTHGERLFAQAHRPCRFLRVEGGKHAPPDDDDYFATVRAFMAETVGTGGRSSR
jgi:fermentation-respiration switch protein FrsA (DUF1100 family)